MGYSADTIREIFRLIDWMMHLRLDLSKRFEAELVAYEKERQMPYVTSVERIAEQRGLEKGMEKGREEGREQGSAILLLQLLTRLCGELPPDVQREIRGLSLEQRQNLTEALLDFKSLADLKNWFENATH